MRMRKTRRAYELLLVLGVLTTVWSIGMTGTPQALANAGGVFTLGPDMNVARMSHAIAHLPDGKVALFGGHGTGFVSLTNAEIWDPITNSFALMNMNDVRDFGAIAKLADGRILLAGGAFDLGVAPGTNSAELFDPATYSFTSTGPMTYGRTNCNAATLASGNVLVVGGWYDGDSSTYPEVFYPATNSFATTGPLNSPRSHPVVLPTHDGKAVVLGGLDAYGTSYIERVELFDPATNGFTVFQEGLFPGETGWTIVGQPKKPIGAQRLEDGRFVLLAGRSEAGVTEFTLFTFNPLTKEIAKFPTMPALPNSNFLSYYDAPMVDQAASRIYLIGLVHPPVDPYQYKLLAVNATNGELSVPPGSTPLPATGWYLTGLASTVLPGGKLFVTGGTSTQDWYQNFNPVQRTMFIQPTVNSRLIWYNDLEHRATWSAPLVINGKVVIQFQDGGVGCYNALDGTPVWFNGSTAGGVSSPIFHNGWIYLTSGNFLYQINPETGSIEQQFDAGEHIWSAAPGAWNNRVYLSTMGMFFAVDTASFTVSWSKPKGSGNIVIGDDTVILLSDQVYAFDAGTGSLIGTVASPTGGAFVNGALHPNNDILTAIGTGPDGWTAILFAYELPEEPGATPSLLWSAPVGQGPDFSIPVIDVKTGIVYVTTRSGILYAFALEGDGTPMWTLPVRGEGLAPAQPIAVDGKVFIQKEMPAAGMMLVGLDGLTGSVLWESGIAGPIAWGEPALVDNVIYLATDWGGLSAFDAGEVLGNWYMVKHNPNLTGSDNGWTPTPPNPLPRPDIKANGLDGPVMVNSGVPVSITVGLNPGDFGGFVADFWIAVHTPFPPPSDWYTYVYPTGWQPGVHLCAQVPLFAFSDIEIMNMALPQGPYTFYFAIDPPDGIPTAEVMDSVQVMVHPF